MRSYAPLMLEVRVLGPMRVVVDGAGGSAGEPRAWSLLAYLALHPGAPAGGPRRRFWPDVSTRAPAQSLRSAVWAIRRALGRRRGVHLAGTRDQIGSKARLGRLLEARALVG